MIDAARGHLTSVIGIIGPRPSEPGRSHGVKKRARGVHFVMNIEVTETRDALVIALARNPSLLTVN